MFNKTLGQDMFPHGLVSMLQSAASSIRHGCVPSANHVSLGKSLW